ncbi:MAG: hypothetical protein U0694_25320 [Anaerolineae bacterium]
MKLLKLALLTLLMALAAAGCNFGSVGVERNAQGGVDVTITLSESEVNTLISEAITRAEENGRAVRIQNPSVDLQAGQIVISGDYEQQNGTGNFVNGSITLGVTVADGHVSVNVTAANIEGFTANDERLTAITDRINEALNNRASRDNGANITLTSITVSDNDMTMVINVQR